jgi:uncharacterized membrane protein
MKYELIALIAEAWRAIAQNGRWMSWNLFLALVPLAVSFFLFYRPRSRVLLWGTGVLLGATFLPNTRHVFAYLIHLVRDVGKTYVLGAIAITLILMALDLFVLRQRGVRSLRWWAGFLVFIAFLPNAPYVLTDIIHLIDQIRWGNSVWIITLALIPQYLLFMVVGFEAYVLSVISLGYYLRQQGLSHLILITELIVHALCAIGIYLGRFIRFNSWDIITNPDEIVNTVLNDLIGKRPFLLIVVTFIVISFLYWLMKQVTFAIGHKHYATQPKEALPNGEVM